MITFMDPKDILNQPDEGLDSQLWHACAGSMVKMPPLNSKVFYFPQGHAEHACESVDFRNSPRIPAYIACRVSAIRFLADEETDEVYAKINLVPIIGNEVDLDNDGFMGIDRDDHDRPTSIAKILTQSDANNGGGFSVPRFCADTIFPPLDYTADPPLQTILAKDVHGETWKFRHIYRGTPRRHLLTTGWSTFVNHKQLVAGDSIVFLRTKNGDLCVGIRRAKMEISGGPKLASDWNPAGEKGRVRAESVIEAATHAANGHPFEVIYYPRASTPEFCVKASLVEAALQIHWRSGMRFKMPFETEDLSRISWFMGTICSVQDADPIHWPDSPWRLLQVTWDEPDLLQNVKRVSPWLVEFVSKVPTIHHFPFSSPRKKLRLTHPDYPLNGQLLVPTFSGNLLGHNSLFGCLPDNTPAGMQGARHAQYGLPLSDLHFNIFQPALFPVDFPVFNHGVIHTRPFNSPIIDKPSSSENISCLLSMSNSTRTSKTTDNQKSHQFFLFGQPILTEKQIMSLRCADGPVSPVRTGNKSLEDNANKMENCSSGSSSGFAVHQHGIPVHPTCEMVQQYKDNHRDTENLETGHCKVFLESEDVGRTLDLSLLASYEDLYKKLASMFDINSSEIMNHVLYRNMTGAVKQIGDDPFSDFKNTARRLMILTD